MSTARLPAPTVAQLCALATFARAAGREWKLQLWDAWSTGRAVDPELQALRNSHGPRWLATARFSVGPEGLRFVA